MTLQIVNDLVDHAKREDWDYVDEQVDQLKDNSAIIKWAYEHGLADPNGNVRDLAATICEKSQLSIDNKKRDRLGANLSDTWPYAAFRAACALAAHGPGSYKGDVIITLKRFLVDDDTSVKDRASRYLSGLER